MGRELQKRKRRSSRATVRQPQRRKKALNPMGNSIIAKNWDKTQTLSQNYRRLGLVAKLGTLSGGVDKSGLPKSSSAQREVAASHALQPFGVKPLPPVGAVGEARIERDAEGRVVRVVHTSTNPLNDPLSRFDSPAPSEDGEGGGNIEAGGAGGDDDDDDEAESRRPAVVRALERQASRPTEKRARHPSRREVEWLGRLVAHHGADTVAMARDMRLNPMQQTQADIERRLRKAGMFEGSG